MIFKPATAKILAVGSLALDSQIKADISWILSGGQKRGTAEGLIGGSSVKVKKIPSH